MVGNPNIRAGYFALALRLQEASNLSNNDVARRLGDAVQNATKGTGWSYYLDHFGDADAGDVVYSCNGSYKRAPYSVAAGGDGDDSAVMYSIDTDNAVPVYPRTIYEAQPDEDDHYAQMAEAFVNDKLYTDLPLYERFISKKEREGADDSDFAGKGKSYPILKPEDIPAAAHALGRAGSDNLGVSTIKARIIAIAKRKGWVKSLPKAWQDGGSTSTETTGKESAGINRQSSDEDLSLVESAVTVEAIELREGAGTVKSDYEIKLIAPGKGTTAYYPADVLKRDGPKVFTEGTKIFLNHATAAEEKARPEGDVNNLAGVLASNAEYRESHIGPAGKDLGPGLYARMKVFADHASTIAEKAKHVGMSIRAYGEQAVQEGKKLVREGVPVLGAFRGRKSVDVVAEAGAGGMILAEAAGKPMKTKKKPMKDCADCKGTGQCATCSGTGELKEAAKAATECTDCEGSGECSACEGNGKLMESARSTERGNKEMEMDEAQVKALIESAVNPIKAKLDLTEAALVQTKAEAGPLLDRALKGDAREAAVEVLRGLPLRESAKEFVIEECLVSLPIKDGKFDIVAFKESVTAKAKRVASMVGTGSNVIGMGAAPIQIDAKEATAKAEEVKQFRESAEDSFTRLMGGNQAAAKAAVSKGVAA